MEKISKKFHALLKENADIRNLFVLVHSFDTSLPTCAQNREEYGAMMRSIDEDKRPAWSKPFFSDEKMELRDVLLAVVDGNDMLRRDCYTEILSLLQTMLYAISAIIPMINEENAYNMALGNPFALWVYDYAHHIEALCTMAMVLCTEDEANVPQCLIRLPNAMVRCRTILFPMIRSVNEKSKEECRPEYLGLLNKRKV